MVRRESILHTNNNDNITTVIIFVGNIDKFLEKSSRCNVVTPK